MKLLVAILSSLVILVASPAHASQTLTGAFVGTFTGDTTDKTASFAGNVEGQWLATISTDGSGASSIAASGSGTFGAPGLSGVWQITSYDAANSRLRLTWSAPGNRGPLSGSVNGAADGSADLTLDGATMTATGSFTGDFYLAGVVKTVTGTWVVKLREPASSVITGTVNGSFAGSASYVGSVSGPVTGNWSANLHSDGSITGSASGSFNGGSVSVPFYGSVCICGTWVGTLTQSSQGVYSFQGSWVQAILSGTAEGRGGGSMSWVIDTGATPFTATGGFSGSTSFHILTLNIPIAASGTWTATLPLSP